MHRVAGRVGSSLSVLLLLLLLLPVLLLCGARGQELTTIKTQDMRRMMMTNSNASSTTATKALGSSANRTAVPGLPELPDTDAPLQSVQEDARAAIAALRSAVDYDGRKKVPSREPVWRRGVSSFKEGSTAAAAFAATTAAAAVTARADGAAVGSGGAVPEGVVVEEYEVLSEERESGAVVDGQRSRERLWVTLTVARPAASSSSGSEEEGASSSSSSPSYPALFLLHSTAGSRARTRARLLRAAERGYVALAPDFRYFGTRGRLWEAAAAAEEDTNTTNAKTNTTKLEADFALYESELVRSFRGGGADERPFLIDNLWDLQRVLDWLFYVGTGEKKNTKKLFNVDASRVGTTGISLGGLHSVLFAVLEQERIAAVAPAIGVPTFAWGAAHEGEWEPRAASIPKVFDVAASDSGSSRPTAEDYVRVLNAIAPGLLGPYDASRSLAAIAPRPLLIANGARDGRNPLGGVGQAVARARKVYASHNNSSGNLEYFLDEGAGHEYTPLLEDKVDAWLDEWLLNK